MKYPACTLVSNFATILAALALSGAAWVAAGHPGSGAYEISLYHAYPAAFWILIVSTILMGQLAVWLEIFSARKSYGWLYPLSLVLLAHLLILSLPLLRHYAFASQWDDVNHFAQTLTLLDTGRPDPADFYPAAHLLVAAFSRLAGLDLHAALLLFSPIFYLVYLANMAFVACLVDGRPGARGLVLSFSLPLGYATFSSVFRPVIFSVYLLPLLFGWLYKTRLLKASWVDSLPFLLILIFLPFLHPWAVLTAALLLLALSLARLLSLPFAPSVSENSMFLDQHSSLPGQLTDSSQFTIRNSPLASTTLPRTPAPERPPASPLPSTPPLALLSVIWLTWFSSFEIFAPSLRRVLNSFTLAITAEHSLSDYLDKTQRIQMPPGKIVSLIVFNYGPAILLLALAAVAIIGVINGFARKKHHVSLDLLALSVFTLALSSFAGLTLCRDLIAEGPLRLTNFVLALFPLVAGRFFYARAFYSPGGRLRTPAYHPLIRFSLFLALAIASVIGGLSVHYSPLAGQPSQAFTFAEQAGVHFLLENSLPDDKAIYSPFGGSFILSSAMNSRDLAQLRQSQPRWWIQPAPDHFDLAGFANPGYLFVTAPEYAYYHHVWPAGGRLTLADFQSLVNDPTWHQLYHSGDFTLWRKAAE